MRQSHINQLLSYVRAREQEGWYYGNREQFEKRHEEIKEWLEMIAGSMINKGKPIPNGIKGG